ncbi:DUF5007 domain-containing protein [Sphingobacterium bovistauri]|uniref:DUF5007 domain-containing protein n=1 Tax=Sphingobacterium bovistauri TaxID=2781959 RepID=A0ABS7Z977_9SPHI|nr:DUF5007 domain-containing protein [Sphingobacterium bovistauri]MCA5006748.1 DUF5007 domain-containing protein [Sphingobacterium bovistauri]
MKNIYKLTFNILLVVILCSTSCKEVEVGYLSENIRYGSNPVVVDKGVFKIVTGIIPDNSTPPFKISILDVRNKQTGVREEAFFKESEITVWKERYDPKTDTTLALIDAKREKQMTLPFQIIEKSGQLMFTQATDNIPTGEYLLDIVVENSKGRKEYKSITTLQVKDPLHFEHINAPYYTLVKPEDGTGVRYPHDVDWFDINNQQSATTRFEITRDAQGPNQIILKVYDKHGKVFPGKALQRRPDGTGFLKTMQTFAYKTTVTEDAVIHDYAQARFPDVYWDSQTNGILCYYRIYDEYIESADYVDVWNPPYEVTYKTDPRPYILQMRFGLKFNLPGTYLVEIHLRATKKPGK